MKRFVLTTACALTLFANAAFAQTPAPRPAPAPPSAGAPRAASPAPPAPPAAPKTQPINIKVDITISALGGTVTPTKKTVTLVTGDGLSGSIRNSTSDTRGFPTMPLNVDARPTLLPDGKIRLVLSLTYDTPTAAPDSSQAVPPKAGLNESLQLILESGKSIVAAESPAPIGDFQYTIEVRATVLK